MFLRDSMKTACPSPHIVWPRKEREVNPFPGCCNYTAWSSQAVYLPAGDVTAPSARKLLSSTLKSRFIIHELQNLKSAIKVFSNNNNKKGTTAAASIMEALDLFLVFSHEKSISWTRKRWHRPDVTVHYRRFLSLLSVKMSWPSADPSSGQGGVLLLLPHHTLTEPVWQRQAGATASHFKAASVTQILPLVAQTKEEPKNIHFTFFP